MNAPCAALELKAQTRRKRVWCERVNKVVRVEIKKHSSGNA